MFQRNINGAWVYLFILQSPSSDLATGQALLDVLPQTRCFTASTSSIQALSSSKKITLSTVKR
jgi:hypothetical protein